MTFEEFLEKKKIDRIKFRESDLQFYEEFLMLYQQMGPKSFDHSKKFLFNKLRRLYGFQSPGSTASSIEINQVAAQALPLISPTIEPSRNEAGSPAASTNPEVVPPPNTPAYKPRFKAPAVPNKTEIDNKPAEQGKKPTYIPRFKAGSNLEKSDPAITTPSSATDITKVPGSPDVNDPPISPLPFRPRFRSGGTKPQ